MEGLDAVIETKLNSSDTTCLSLKLPNKFTCMSCTRSREKGIGLLRNKNVWRNNKAVNNTKCIQLPMYMII